MSAAPTTRCVGFTLIELAVAIFVIALLLGSLLVPLSTQVEQKQISDTQKTLEEIKEALVGFAAVNGYLPCPDTDNDGLEEVSATGSCSVVSGSTPNFFSMGNVPWASLGVANADVWGNRFRYIVLAPFAQRPPATPFSLNTASNAGLRVCLVAACTPSAQVLTSTAVAVILSHGKNGYGAINSISGLQNPLASSADEQENYDVDRDTVSRSRTDATAAAGEFDDIVTWLSKYILFNRMVTAGKLP